MKTDGLSYLRQRRLASRIVFQQLKRFPQTPAGQPPFGVFRPRWRNGQVGSTPNKSVQQQHEQCINVDSAVYSRVLKLLLNRDQRLADDLIVDSDLLTELNVHQTVSVAIEAAHYRRLDRNHQHTARPLRFSLTKEKALLGG